MLLLDAFRLHALHSPGNVLMRDGRGEKFTYRQVWNVSELLGAHLIEQTELGTLKEGEPVAILGWDEPLLVGCILACAKSKHPHVLVGKTLMDVLDGLTSANGKAALKVLSECKSKDFAKDPCSSKVILAPTTKLADLVRAQLGSNVKVFDGELMLSYIVPGMSDDFSCGCGDDDCVHGPFLQECMPSQWFADTGIFAIDYVNSKECHQSQMTISLHDAMLTKVLMGGGSAFRPNELYPQSGMETCHSNENLARSGLYCEEVVPLNLCTAHLAATLAAGEEISFA